MPGVVAVATGRDLPIPSASCRSPRTSTRSASTACASSATRSRPSRPSTRTPAFDALDAIEVEYEPLPPIASIEEALATPRAAHPRLRRRRQLPQARLDGVRRRRGGLRRRRPRSSRTSSSTRATRTCRWSSTPRSRDFGPDGKLTLWSSTQTPHYVHRALAKVLEHAGVAHPRRSRRPTAAASAARPTRSTTRSSSRKLSRVTGRPVKICLTREEVFYCHRGRHPMLMRVKTGVKKDGAHHGACTSRRCSTAAPTAPTASPRPTTPARSRP